MTVWAATVVYIAALLFQVGVIAPAVLIGVTTVAACAAVVPAVNRWADQ